MLEILSKKFESPADEIRARMRFLGRRVDGTAQAKLNAAMRMLALADLTPSKAKSYWHAAVNDVPSHHMDRARSLTGAANDNGHRLPCRAVLIARAA